MGTYINPGYNAFLEINNDDFVDKTMLIDLINKTIRKKDKKLTCVSRPRRFGKSYAARMLVAYYDCSCNSEALFNDKKIAQTKLYKDHMYQYNIIRLDISEFTSTAIREGTPLHDVANTIVNTLHEELLEMEPDCSNKLSLKDLMLHSATKQGGKQFIFIIDEWDAVIREARHDAEAQDRFLSLLREWFKNEAFTPYVVAAAYMTGILPIKKYENPGLPAASIRTLKTTSCEARNFSLTTAKPVQYYS